MLIPNTFVPYCPTAGGHGPSVPEQQPSTPELEYHSSAPFIHDPQLQASGDFPNHDCWLNEIDPPLTTNDHNNGTIEVISPSPRRLTIELPYRSDGAHSPFTPSPNTPPLDGSWSHGTTPSTSSFHMPSPVPNGSYQSCPDFHYLGNDMNGLTLSSIERCSPPNVSPERLVPQRAYRGRTRFDVENGINISFSTHGGTRGFPLSHAKECRYEDLEGRDDKTPLILTGTSISLRIEWPDYEPWTYQMRCYDWKKEPTPLPKSKLATDIAKTIDRFINEMQNKTHPDSEWRVGPTFIETTNLVLVGLTQVSRSSYQPILRLAV